MANHNIQNLICALGAVVFYPSTVLACSVCFGDKDSNLTQATTMGIWFMLAILAIVLGATAKFIFSFIQRAKFLNN